jgi:nitrite reductase/ring-hydroxylating ferredoxin subunit
MHAEQIATMAKLEQESLIGTQVAGVELIAVACGDKVNVFEGRCPHQGTLLSEGYVEDGRLVCRGHGWQYDCASGVKVEDEDICLRRFSVLVNDGKVLVDRAEVEAWAAERREGQASWRATLENVHTREALSFATERELLVYLLQTFSDGPDSPDTKANAYDESEPYECDMLGGRL